MKTPQSMPLPKSVTETRKLSADRALASHVAILRKPVAREFTLRRLPFQLDMRRAG